MSWTWKEECDKKFVENVGWVGSNKLLTNICNFQLFVWKLIRFPTLHMRDFRALSIRSLLSVCRRTVGTAILKKKTAKVWKIRWGLVKMREVSGGGKGRRAVWDEGKCKMASDEEESLLACHFSFHYYFKFKTAFISLNLWYFCDAFQSCLVMTWNCRPGGREAPSENFWRLKFFHSFLLCFGFWRFRVLSWLVLRLCATVARTRNSSTSFAPVNFSVNCTNGSESVKFDKQQLSFGCCLVRKSLNGRSERFRVRMNDPSEMSKEPWKIWQIRQWKSSNLSSKIFEKKTSLEC